MWRVACPVELDCDTLQSTGFEPRNGAGNNFLDIIDNIRTSAFVYWHIEEL
jgi:hypothetical protein